MSDSMYGYLPKMYALLGGLMPLYRKLYEQFMTAAIKHLFFGPFTPLMVIRLIMDCLHELMKNIEIRNGEESCRKDRFLQSDCLEEY